MTDKDLNQTREKIALQIKNRREELGMKQTDIQALTGLGIATISRFESGKFWLGMKQYILLRKVLNMPDL